MNRRWGPRGSGAAGTFVAPCGWSGARAVGKPTIVGPDAAIAAGGIARKRQKATHTRDRRDPI